MTPTEHRIQTSFDRQGLLHMLGATLVMVSPGRVQIAAPLHPGVSQQHGTGHSGFIFTLAEAAAGCAALTRMPAEAEVMTVEMKINLLAPALGEGLIATGEVVKAGQRLVVVRAEVHAQSGESLRSVAVLQGTVMPVQPTALHMRPAAAEGGPTG